MLLWNIARIGQAKIARKSKKNGPFRYLTTILKRSLTGLFVFRSMYWVKKFLHRSIMNAISMILSKMSKELPSSGSPKQAKYAASIEEVVLNMIIKNTKIFIIRHSGSRIIFSKMAGRSVSFLIFSYSSSALSSLSPIVSDISLLLFFFLSCF